jgi:trehalose 6-phosphate phosphatase
MRSPAIKAGSTPPIGDFAPASLFIDFDGTLVDLMDRPDGVAVDSGLQSLLRRLNAALPGRIALVSGRSIAQLDGFLGPLAAALNLAGSHGVELRRSGDALVAPKRPSALEAVERALTGFATARPGVLVESKSHGVALHYRGAPECEAAARDFCDALGGAGELIVQPGKMMIEVMTRGDKGDAVRAFMRDPSMAGTRPLFIGDDLTDEGGFAAAHELGGAGVLVGEPRKTAARYRLRDVPAVRAWLETALS